MAAYQPLGYETAATSDTNADSRAVLGAYLAVAVATAHAAAYRFLLAWQPSSLAVMPIWMIVWYITRGTIICAPDAVDAPAWAFSAAWRLLETFPSFRILRTRVDLPTGLWSIVALAWIALLTDGRTPECLFLVLVVVACLITDNMYPPNSARSARFVWTARALLAAVFVLISAVGTGILYALPSVS